MATPDLEALGLDRRQVRNAVRFHQAYAATALAELETSRLANRSAAPESIYAGSDPAFTLLADAASALREAAQWALLLDPAQATPLLGRAGALFFELGQAFGVYLEVMAGAPEVSPGVLTRALRQLSDSPEGLLRDEENDVSAMPEIRFQHQQQAYLVLAASAVAERDRQVDDFALVESLQTTLEVSAHNSGVIPVGSLGTPIHRFWSVAKHLLGDSANDAFVIAQHLVAMCQAYEESIDLARTNTYLWTNGAAPVDIADLDISGIATLTTRRFGRDGLESALADATGGRRLNPIARVPVELGISMAGPESLKRG
jgi:hypothetical protein